MPLTFFFFGRGISDGCVRFINSDSETTRILPVKIPVYGGQFGNSVYHCALACEIAGFTLAGMEFGIECCACRLLDGLSSPDQTWFQKGAAIVSALAVWR